MKSRGNTAIEFPANPFVALADFLFVILVVLILSVIDNTVSSGRIIERVEVARKQYKLYTACMESNNGILRSAIDNEKFMKTHEDGDLQRFWLDGSISFDKQSSKFSETKEGVKILRAFAKILAQQQDNGGFSTFKRISVEGHADQSEIYGSGKYTKKQVDDEVWRLSMARAHTAAKILIDAGIKPWRLEISGRGQWAYDTGPFDAVVNRQTKEQRDAAKRRIEIVVIYTGSSTMNRP